MGQKKIDANLIKSLSELKPANYTSNSSLSDIYSRLLDGRKAFSQIYKLNVNAVSEISALDLEINFYTEKLLKISQSVADATKDIHTSAEESADVSEMIAGRHEDLTNTIIAVYEESSNVIQKIDLSQQNLTEIRTLSENTITVSQKMQNDMNELVDILHNMNQVVEAIHEISSQTNLLSLNASIEAARSGEAGRGFAVVANEIRELADQTRELTSNMGKFVQSIQIAAAASTTSVNTAISALGEVNDKIKNVWALNEENQLHISEINDNISNLASVSEEISSNMNEIQANANEIEKSCSVLKTNTEDLRQIGNDCFEAIKPIHNIEERMDNILNDMGKMTSDSFYALSRDELTEFIDNAITAHRSWVDNLHTIIENKYIIPFQVDASKCKFGHFYYSVNPPEPSAKMVWDKIGEEHQKLHKLGKEVLDCMFDDDIDGANAVFDQIIPLSEQLIGMLTAIIEKIPEKSNEL